MPVARDGGKIGGERLVDSDRLQLRNEPVVTATNRAQQRGSIVEARTPPLAMLRYIWMLCREPGQQLHRSLIRRQRLIVFFESKQDVAEVRQALSEIALVVLDGGELVGQLLSKRYRFLLNAQR